MSSYNGFIFDMDGVLVDNHKFHFQAWMEFADKYKFPLNEEIYRRDFNGKTNADLFRSIFGSISDAEVLAYALEKETRYQEIYRNFMKPVDGLIPFLETLRSKGKKLALGTSAPSTNVVFTLDSLNLRKYFDCIIDGSQVKLGKPNPEVYLLCAKGIDLPPNECVVFEDAILGIQAGKAAGCTVIGVSTSHKREELSDHVETIIDNFLDIEKSLDSFYLDK